MDWRILFVGYLVAVVGSYLLRRHMAQKFSQHTRLINLIFFLGLYPVGLIVGLLTNPDLAIGWTNILFLALGSGIFPLINILSFRANKEVDAGQYALIGNLTPIITIIFATLLLNDVLTWYQFIGALFILTSAFIASAVRLGKGKIAISHGVFLAITCAVLLGFGTLYERWMLSLMDFGAYLIFGWGAQTVWMIAISTKEWRDLKILRSRQFTKPVIIYTAINILKALFFVGALFASANASIISAASGVIPVLVVIAAYFFLKERDHIPSRIFAGTLGLIGLVIIYSS